MAENKKSVIGLFWETVRAIFFIIFGYLVIIPLLVVFYFEVFGSGINNGGTFSNFMSSYFTPAFVTEISCREVNSGTNILIRIINFAFTGSLTNEYRFVMQSGNFNWSPMSPSREMYKAIYGSDVYQILNNGYLVGQLDLRSGNFGFGPYIGENCQSNGIVFGRTWQYN